MQTLEIHDAARNPMFRCFKLYGKRIACIETMRLLHVEAVASVMGLTGRVSRGFIQGETL
jgi:hypothetical protein